MASHPGGRPHMRSLGTRKAFARIPLLLNGRFNGKLLDSDSSKEMQTQESWLDRSPAASCSRFVLDHTIIFIFLSLSWMAQDHHRTSVCSPMVQLTHAQGNNFSYHSAN